MVKLIFQTIQIELVSNKKFINFTEEMVIFQAAKPFDPTPFCR
jgi:hypothetical protein